MAQYTRHAVVSIDEVLRQVFNQWVNGETSRAEFHAGLPKKLYEMQILATKVGIETYVTLTQTGCSVRFSKYEDDSDRYDTVLSYESEEWEVTAMLDTLTSMEAAQAQAAKDLRNAYEIFNRLTPDEQILVKRHIQYIK